MYLFPELTIDANKEYCDEAAVRRCLRMAKTADIPVKMERDGFFAVLYPHYEQSDAEFVFDKARRMGDVQPAEMRFDIKSDMLYMHKYINQLPDAIAQGHNGVIDWIEGLASFSRRNMHVPEQEKAVIFITLKEAGYKPHQAGSLTDVNVNNKKAVAEYIVGAFLNQLQEVEFTGMRFQYMSKILREYWSFKDPKPKPITKEKIRAEKQAYRPQ